ncbi:hypothetical protein C0J29_20745 [Mycobacterium paragordonae]|uniref:Uncharacterized protein n=1 Tax=Mycobacterium paragordonae TaxID=1389713 RepID=A0ABQ1C847_9MYCO|nr:hypothetical protein [Mycobacterium paragordonae]AYE96860.1 hypothetical protein C0J29_20745 [Mycobacterium paragordonae]OBK54138.1 hypothetical protein A5656_23100 [Mycobacterium gordonae]GFG80409.1 hypothetical protein MPRG_36850 [Mycobacterium paragordonae]
MLVAVAVLIAAAVALVLFAASGSRRALAGAPGLDLTYPAGKLIEDNTSDAIFGASAYRVRGYATDAETADIIGYFDAELAGLGYRTVPATSDPVTRFQNHPPLRQYQNDQFNYRLYLLDIPYKLSRNVIITGYRHALFTELTN